MDELEPQQAEATEAEAEAPEAGTQEAGAPQSVSMEELMAPDEPDADAEPPVSLEDAQLQAVLEAIVYVAEEPLTVSQIAVALGQPLERIRDRMQVLMAEFDKPEHGLAIREVAGGYKLATKAEHHDSVRNFVKSLKPPLKLSLPALETLAVIAYKQPVTTPEILEIRGVQGGGVIKTLLDRKLIGEAGRKNVIGKPILYKTTREFLIQFGLKDLAELPSLKEFEELGRMAFAETEPEANTDQGELALAEPVVEGSAEVNAELAMETPGAEAESGTAEGPPVAEEVKSESQDH
jgi:segregation and condensation protein B